MSKKTWFFGATVLALIGGGVLVHNNWSADGASARQPNRGNANRVVPVEIAKAVKKQVPIQLNALGTVTPIASVAIKTRVDTTITAVHFQDGARVEKGETIAARSRRT